MDWTRGWCDVVSEQEIADAKAVIGRDGIGCEPASATTLAGIKRMVKSGVIDSSANILAVLTGNLLKDPAYTIDYHTGKLGLDEGGARREVKGKFENRSVRVAADKEKIKLVIAN